MFPIGEKEISKLLDMKYIKDIYISGTRGFLYNTFIISGAVTFEKDNSSFSNNFSYFSSLAHSAINLKTFSVLISLIR